MKTGLTVEDLLGVPIRFADDEALRKLYVRLGYIWKTLARMTEEDRPKYLINDIEGMIFAIDLKINKD